MARNSITYDRREIDIEILRVDMSLPAEHFNYPPRFGKKEMFMTRDQRPDLVTRVSVEFDGFFEIDLRQGR